MSFRLSSLGCCLTLAVFGSSLVTRTEAQTESRPRRAIELAETNNTEVLTRPNQLTDKKEAFKEPEGEWKKAFESLSLENRAESMAPQYVPPRPAPVPNKRMKDLLERKRNWMMAPEDLLPENSGEDWTEGNDSV